MNKLWFKRNLSEAVEEPRLHNQLVPKDDVFYEKLPIANSEKYVMRRDIREGLEELRHNVTGDKSFAVVQAIFRDPETKDIFAKSDSRKHGEPAGR